MSTMIGSDQFSADDLILEVSLGVDPARLNLTAYSDFLDALTRGRTYQREAIEAALRLLFGGRYDSTADLARERYADSDDLQRRYSNIDKLLARLPFPDKLACSLDIATGAGKSFVMYAIARIALNEGLVDRVLVLAPSLTIEDGLIEKFNALTADTDLTEQLPEREGHTLPEIVTADSTVKEGQICVENIHAVYERTGSSIDDSFAGQGAHTLVISDEAHHIYSPEGGALKRWKEFLENEKYGFRYLVGVSGTCYVDNEPFSDIVYRYSIRQAMDDGWIKEVYYLDQDSSTTQHEIFQKLLNRHEQNRKRYKPQKPLTISITKDIKAAEKLEAELIEFLSEHMSADDARRRVLVVTSADKHKQNLLMLKTVDELTSPIEWIVSVSMLTEGWDVQNVFQIYPHEKRAFNSRLLVSQVLGRGLRRRPGSGDTPPIVYVFNHPRWGLDVENLVAAVLDQETRFAAAPVNWRPVEHFDLHDVDYLPVPTSIEAKVIEKPKGLPKLENLRTQGDANETTTFVSVIDKTRAEELVTKVVEKRYPTADVVAAVRKQLLTADKRVGTELATAYPKKDVEKSIVDGLKRLGLDGKEVSQENRQLILSAFGALQQKKTRAGAEFAREPQGFRIVNTMFLPTASDRLSRLTGNSALFYDELSEKHADPDGKAALRKAAALKELQSKARIIRVKNSFHFKSPTNIVLASHEPEYRFISDLLREENAGVITAWVKSTNTSFYGIEYSRTNGKRTPSTFNPDFFLLLDHGDVAVVETKYDKEKAKVNPAKLAFACEHFDIINAMLAEEGESRRYHFHFLSPQDYDKFFEAVRNGAASTFISTLQARISAGTDEAAELAP